MVERMQLNKTKQKRLVRLSSNVTNDKEVSSYFYPKNNLYTKHEVELLDTIYSDEPLNELISKQETDNKTEDYWTTNKEKYRSVPRQNSNLFTNLKWCLSGAALTSVIWLVFFQIKVHELKTTDNIQIVFHKSAEIITDKTVDSNLTNALAKNHILSDFFSKKPKVAKVKSNEESQIQTIEENQTPKEKPSIAYHVIQNGDSLWLIAKEYYGNPSPTNIKKIEEANDMGRNRYLYPGKKIIIPL